ncbi:FDLD family class I lanthipeptide [Tumebacillus avium]|nr:FDLD family class I lanthipeptide [Tumebacillus avium]
MERLFDLDVQVSEVTPEVEYITSRGSCEFVCDPL